MKSTGKWVWTICWEIEKYNNDDKEINL